MRIYYDRDTGTFLKVKTRKKEQFDTVLLDAKINEDLHDFFDNVYAIIKDEDGTIEYSEFTVKITRKRLTGEVLGCVAPYTTCEIYHNEPYKFLETFI